jgi:hypothetical protein
VIVEEVAGRVAEDLVEGLPGRALVGAGEEGLDPGGVEALLGPGPAPRSGRSAAGLDPFASLVQDDGEPARRGRRELRGDPERRPAAPERPRRLDVPGRTAEGQADLPGIALEDGQDARDRPGTGCGGGNEDGPPAGEGLA